MQDAGSQLAAELLDAKEGMRVLDACAAPGGKTAHSLELADVDMTALEIDPKRASRITENLDRLGLKAKVTVADAGDPKNGGTAVLLRGFCWMPLVRLQVL